MKRTIVIAVADGLVLDWARERRVEDIAADIAVRCGGGLW